MAKTTATLTKRNKMAAGLALVSGIVFIASGYNVNVGIYDTIESGLQEYSPREIWEVAIIPLSILALIAQLGGFAVLAWSFLILKNHITSGKLLVTIGTGQGIITIAATLILEQLHGGFVYANNYILWLATSATGLGIVLSIVARSVAKPVQSEVSG